MLILEVTLPNKRGELRVGSCPSLRRAASLSGSSGGGAAGMEEDAGAGGGGAAAVAPGAVGRGGGGGGAAAAAGAQPGGEGLLCGRWAPGGSLLAVGQRGGASRGLKPPLGDAEGGSGEAKGVSAPAPASSWGGALQARALRAAPEESAERGTPERCFHEYPEATNAAHGTEAPAPTTALCFRPLPTAQGTKNLYLAGSTNGELQLVHATTGKVTWTGREEGNKLYAVEYQPGASRFATGGDDACLRVYDAVEMREERAFGPADGFGAAGHSDPIYSLKWHPTNPCVLFTAGWDQTVQMWDTRKKNPCGSIFGAYVCGDALDLTTEGLLLTGSWRSQRSLQMWDIRRDGPVKEYAFQQAGEGPSMLYAARVLPGGHVIAAGGSGSEPSVRFFNRHSGELLARNETGASVHALDIDCAPGRPARALVVDAESLHVFALPAAVAVQVEASGGLLAVGDAERPPLT